MPKTTAVQCFWHLDVARAQPPRFSGCLRGGAATHQTTPTGRLKRAFFVDARHWNFEVWGGISFKIVEKSFKVMGISNKFDGMEDNLRYLGKRRV